MAHIAHQFTQRLHITGILSLLYQITQFGTQNAAENRLKEVGAILNWFDIEEKDGRLSLNSKMSDVISTMRGKLLFAKLMGKMLGGFTVLRLLTMAGGMMDAKFTKEDLLNLNRKLSRIKAPKK